METIKEDYVSFETAKLLKEKRFDAKCDKCYAYFTDDDIRWMGLSYPKSAQVLSENRYPCITLQMAMKWLREVHNINIEIFVIKNYDKKICEYTYTIMDLNFPGSDDGIDCCNKYKTYEQACEAAIKYCLKKLV